MALLENKKVGWREACTFPVAVAVERVRQVGEARREFVTHLSHGEQNSFWRIVKAEFGLDKPLYQDDE
jgi:hypothetical protein